MRKTFLLVLLSSTFLFGKIWKRNIPGVGGGGTGSTGTPTVPFTFTAPVLRQINQRNSLNQCQITVQGATATGTTAQVRATPVATFPGTQSDWQSVNIDGSGVNGPVTVSGGWYTLEIKVFNGNSYISNKVSDKVGCGDNFLIGGQSNGDNYYQPLDSTPPNDRVSSRGITALLPWRLATDPQDTADNVYSSIVPSLGNLLSTHTGYPVGFISVALGNTYVHDWIPTNANYLRIRSAIALFPGSNFRAFLWIHGENDASAGTSQSSYTTDLESIIDQIRIDAGYQVPCGIPVSETHPYEATGAGVLAAQTAVANYGGCFTGANPDSLGNSYRSDTVHFNTTTGQSAHATMWYNAIVSAFGI